MPATSTTLIGFPIPIGYRQVISARGVRRSVIAYPVGYTPTRCDEGDIFRTLTKDGLSLHGQKLPYGSSIFGLSLHRWEIPLPGLYRNHSVKES